MALLLVIPYPEAAAKRPSKDAADAGPSPFGLASLAPQGDGYFD